MRRLGLALALLAALAVPLPAPAVPPAAAGALASANVEFLLNLPDVVANGGRILGNLLYVTTAQGLRVYDLSMGIPLPVGALELPHFANEDVDTDGRLLLIATDYLVSPRQAHAVYVVDVSNPRAPLLRGVATGLTQAHTVSCVGRTPDGRRSCEIAWTSGGDVLDLRDPARPIVAGQSDALRGHDTSVDSTGIAFTDSHIFDTTAYGPHNLLSPPQLGWHGAGWHGTSRPHAHEAPAKLDDDVVDRGELVLGTNENWLATQNNLCRSDGRFLVSALKRTGSTLTTRPLASFSIGNGTVPKAKPVAATCSSHWFSEHESVVANAWYEQGVRFLDVSSFLDPARPDAITEIGYYMPAAGSALSALFREVTGGPLPGLYVYVLDLERGIDVLRFTGRAGDPPAAPADDPASAGTPGRVAGAEWGFRPHPVYGWACRVPAGRD